MSVECLKIRFLITFLIGNPNMEKGQEVGLGPRKSLNDVYIEDAEKILDRNGLTID
jgi:hypothetical protein